MRGLAEKYLAHVHGGPPCPLYVFYWGWNPSQPAAYLLATIGAVHLYVRELSTRQQAERPKGDGDT